MLTASPAWTPGFHPTKLRKATAGDSHSSPSPPRQSPKDRVNAKISGVPKRENLHWGIPPPASVCRARNYFIVYGCWQYRIPTLKSLLNLTLNLMSGLPIHHFADLEKPSFLS